MKGNILLLVLIIITLSGKLTFSAPCELDESIDISDGVVQNDNSIIFNNITYLTSQVFNYDYNGTITKRGCVCLIKTCLRKCCVKGNGFLGKDCTESDDILLHPFSPPVYNGKSSTSIIAHEHFNYMYGMPMCNEKLFMDVTQKTDESLLQMNGELYVIGGPAEVTHVWSKYCMEIMLEENSTGRLVAIVCADDTEDVETSSLVTYLYSVGLILSTLFLIITLIVYALLPELRNLHGKCLMSYLIALIIAYGILSYLRLQPGSVTATMTFCIVMGFIIYYAFLASFFWMNAMCFDIWRTFSGYGGMGLSSKRDRNRFLFYSLYSWGVAALITSFAVFVQFYENIPDHIVQPYIGLAKCWFFDFKSELYYFFIPIILLVSVNLLMFIITTLKINAIQRETSILKGADSSRNIQYNRDKERFILYIRLVIVMGITWTVEIISFSFGGADYYWIISDLANMLLGLVIFVTFVCKKKVWESLVKRYKIFKYGDDYISSRTSATSKQNHTTHTDDTRLTEQQSTHTHVEAIQLTDIQTKM